MPTTVTSSKDSQESAQGRQDRPASYINKFGREIELRSPLLFANEELRLREIWRVQSLDLDEGEMSQLWDVMNNESFHSSEEEALEYIRTKIPEEQRWSAVVTKHLGDQYERLFSCPLDDQGCLQVSKIDASAESLPKAHDVVMSLWWSTISNVDRKGDRLRSRLYFVSRVIQKALAMAKRPASDEVAA